jgi:hypothetical protein
MGPLWSGTGHPVGRAEACKVKICVPHRRKSGLSPLYRISAMQLMPAITVETNTFNNHLGFERGLWKHQTRRFVVAPKRRVFGSIFVRVWVMKNKSTYSSRPIVTPDAPR